MRRSLMVLLWLAIQFCPAAQSADWQANEQAGEKAYTAERNSESVKYYSLALQQAKQFGSRDPRYVMDLDHLACAYQGLTKYELAESLFKQARTIGEQIYRKDDPRLAIILADLGQYYRARGWFQEAAPLLMRAVAIDEKTLTAKDRYLAEHLVGLGALYSEEGKLDEAETLYKKALSMDDQFRPNDPDTADHLDNLANIYEDQAKFKEAEPLSKRALAIREKAFGKLSVPVSDSLAGLAGLYEEEKRSAEAERLYRQALAICEKTLGTENQDPELAERLAGLAQFVDTQLNDEDEAEQLYKRALALLSKTYGPDSRFTAVTISNMGTFCSSHGRSEEAERYYKKALAITDKAYGPNNQSSATTLYNLAFLNDEKKDYKTAANLYKRSLAIREKLYGTMHPSVALNMRALACDYVKLDKYAEAEPLMTRVLEIDKKSQATDQSKNIEEDMRALMSLYEKQGKYFQSEAMYKRFLAILQATAKTGNLQAANDLAEQMRQYASYVLRNASRKNVPPPPLEAKVESVKKDEDDSWQTKKLGAYIVRYKLTYEGISEFSLIKDGKQVLRRTPDERDGGILHFINPYDQSEHTWEVANLPVAKDINGDGIPDLVFLDIYPDAHSSAAWEILSLSEKGPRSEFKQSVCESRPKFEDLDHDGRLEMITDDVYDWYCCVPDMQRPRVILAWNGTTWLASKKLMAAPKPTPAEMDKMLRELKSFSDVKSPRTGKIVHAAYIHPGVWGKMLDLIYSGNLPAAHELITRIWTGDAVLVRIGVLTRPYSIRYRERFWDDIVDMVRTTRPSILQDPLKSRLLQSRRKTPSCEWELAI